MMNSPEHRARKWEPVFGIKRCDNKDSEHRAKKWEPVFGVKRCDNKDSEHRAKKWEPVFGVKRCDNKDSKRADDAHSALSALMSLQLRRQQIWARYVSTTPGIAGQVNREKTHGTVV